MKTITSSNNIDDIEEALRVVCSPQRGCNLYKPVYYPTLRIPDITP